MEKELIQRKHELLKKQSNEKLTNEEVNELESLEKQNREEIVKIGDAPITYRDVEKAVVKNSEKPKYTVAERKEIALKMIEENKSKDKKEVINMIREKLGVSYTYAFKLFK